MNPSIVNRKKIITKFNLENLDISEKTTKIIDSKDNQEINLYKNIENIENIENTENIENIKNTENIENISLKILSRLPSQILYTSECCENYFYKIKDVTNSSLPPINSKKRIHICIYNIINNNRVSPFILFLLYQYDIFKFPNFKTDEKIIDTAESVLNNIYENFTIKPTYTSYKEGKNNIYLFYEIKEKYKLIQLNKVSKWWWCTISEIVDYNAIMNFDIDRTVWNIFIKEPLLGILFDKNNKKYISGRSLYYGGYENYIAFIAALGLPKEKPDSNLGPYYYFYNYYGAGRRAIWSQTRKEEIYNNEVITRNEYGVHKKGGLVRFIIFANNPKYFLNRADDEEDNSSISQELAKENKFIKESLKIRDVDAKWAVSHDMAYIGTTYIDIPGVKYKPRRLIAQWVVRDFYQYFPLSFHYVNTDEFSKITDKETAINLPYNFKKYDIE